MNASTGASARLPESPRWPPILYGAFAAFVIASAQVVLLAVCFATALTTHMQPTRGWDTAFIAVEVVLVAIAVALFVVGILPRSSRFVRLFALTAGIASLVVLVPAGIAAMGFVSADLGAAINAAPPARAAGR